MVLDRTTGASSRATSAGLLRGDVTRGIDVGPATFSDDVSTVVFGSTAANILETERVVFGASEIFLWDRTVSP
jgi:hypothetical protein